MKPDIHNLPRAHLQALIDALHAAGFRCVGPQAADGAIVYDTLTEVAQLPWGITQTQAPGHYRLHASDDARCFAWANGPQAMKPLLFAPRGARACSSLLAIAPIRRLRVSASPRAMGRVRTRVTTSRAPSSMRVISWSPVLCFVLSLSC